MNDASNTAFSAADRGEAAVADGGRRNCSALTDSIVAALKTVYDPEIPADIYELGLIYNVDIDDSRFVTIDMTLTAPACPVAGRNAALGRKCRRRRPGRVGRRR